MKMEKENLLEILAEGLKGDKYENENYTIEFVTDSDIVIHHKVKVVDEEAKEVGFCLNLLVKQYRKVQKPVTFEEILESDKRCRVEHELFPFIGYSNFKAIFMTIANNYSQGEIKKIMQEGKWYLEE